MKIFGWILSVLVALALGFYAGGRRAQSPANEWRLKFEALQNKFTQLSAIDIEEYTKLKEQKAKYEKADEILGKILLIMLHDLGVRTTGPQIEALATSVKDSKQANATQAGSEKNPKKPTSNAITVSTSATAAAPIQPTFDTTKAKQISNDTDAKDFLKSAELTDFFGAIRSGGPLDQAQIDMLNGTFAGTAVFDDPANSPWQVSIFFFGRERNNSLRGRHDIRLSKNGQEFSHTSGRIDNDQYISAGTDSVGVIIDVYAGSGYFQLFYFPRMNTFYGNVYLKESVGSFKKAGIVQLTKR